MIPEHASSRLRRIGDRTARGLGQITAGLRRPPDFLLIGAKRAGTTSLYYYLLDHPQVVPMFPSATVLPLRHHSKGVHYFDREHGHSERWYRSHFPTSPFRRLRSMRVRGPVVTGESSPYYVFHPRAAERAARVVPAAKVIVLLRDPVERAYSHYKEQRRRGMEPLATFEEAIDAEEARLDGVNEHLAGEEFFYSFAHEHQSYVRQGEYASCLRAWVERFPPPQTLVLFSADLYQTPQDIYDRVCQFLGIGHHLLADAETWNPTDRSSVATDTRERLRTHYASHDEDLARLLGARLPWRD